MKSKFFGLLAGISICAFAAQPAAALSFTFFTPAGSTCGGEACAAEAVITTGAGSISVTLTDLLTPAQVLSAGQALSDLQFTLSNAPGTQGTLTASGQLADRGWRDRDECVWDAGPVYRRRSPSPWRLGYFHRFG